MFCVLIAVDKEAISILHLFQITYQLFVSYVCIIIQGFGKCNTFLQKYGPANVLSLNVLLNFGPAHLLDCGDAERTIFAGVGWQPGGILS